MRRVPTTTARTGVLDADVALTAHRPARLADAERGIAARTARQVVARLAREAERAGRHGGDRAGAAHPYALRHALALRHLADGGTLDRLRQLLGHDAVATTARAARRPRGRSISTACVTRTSQPSTR